MKRHLPCELLEEILDRMRLKDALRCRSLCKAWRSVIDRRRFFPTHLLGKTQAGSNGDSTFIFRPSGWDIDRMYPMNLHEKVYGSSRTYEATEIRIPSVNNTKISYIRTYDNRELGLSCFFYGDKRGDTYIYNPYTQYSIKLPEVTSRLKWTAFTSGCGFDIFSDDYKIVHIFHLSKIEVHVFTLRSNSWRKLESVPKVEVDFNDFAVSLNGSLHWHSGANGYIVTFDLKMEKFDMIPYPRRTKKSEIFKTSVRVLDLSGYLSISFRYNDCTELWIMKTYNDNESWIKHTITLDMWPISFRKSGIILLLSPRKELWSYDVNRKVYACGAFRVYYPWGGNLITLANNL